MEKMRARGIDQAGLEVLKGKESFFWSGKYHYDMNTRDTLETRLNVLLELDPKLNQQYKAAEYLMLGNLDPAVQTKVLDQMDGPALVVLDTMNFWMDIAMDKLKEVIKRVDILTINDSEARQLSGEHSLVKAAHVILARSGDHSFNNMKRAIIVGSAMASFCCEKFGVQRLLELTQEEIDLRIQQFVDLVDFDIKLEEA